MAPKNNSSFCCCSGDMCNVNFTDGYDPAAHTTTPFVPPPPIPSNSYKIKTVIISLVSVFSVALVIMMAYLGFRTCTRQKQPSIESLHQTHSPPVQPEFDMDDLKLSNILSKGRYAEVWKGKLEARDVVVKIYTSHYREYYNNERSIYRTPFMDHEGLLRFFGADERITQDGSAQLMIVMSYIPLGALNGYLKNNTLDWATMVRMAYSVAKAMSHLHTDIQQGDLFKPVLAHRDLNTRNILVRADLTCVVADFGFAVATIGSKLIKRGHAEIAEQTSLTDVGTLRYMAPELLDGAVNLRDCEASLKQIDIYALGLVLWEISLRCVDLFQGAPLPEYAPPFQVEVGSNPTFEDMQMLVVRAKKRPKFPEVWKETNQAVRSLKETIEECWDADAEARLTALCVEERLSDLPNLWAQEIKHRGMTPTLNAMININETSTTTTGTTSTTAPSQQQTSDQLPPHTVPIIDSDDTTAPLLGNRLREFSRSPSTSLTSPGWQHERSVSSGTTDTVLPITPVAENATTLPVKTSNLNQERNSTVLRPHTGRNPTVERNTHKQSDEELRVSGNTLVSSNFAEECMDSLSTPPAEQLSSAESPPDYGPESSLVQNDALSHRNPPIPYVQNQVHGEVPAGRPKVANTTSLRVYARGESSLREKLSRLIRPKELGLRLSGFSFFGGGRSRRDYSRAEDMEVEDLHHEATGVAGQPNGAVVHHVSDLSRGHHHSNLDPGRHSNLDQEHHHSNLIQAHHSNLNQGHSNMGQGQHPSTGQGHHHHHSNLQPVNMEVRIHNGSVVTRPSNLTLSAGHSNVRNTNRDGPSVSRSAREGSINRDSGNGGEPARVCARGDSSEREVSGGASRHGSTSSEPQPRDTTVANQTSGTENNIAAVDRSQRATSEQPHYPENRLRFAEVGVAKLHIPSVSQQPVRRLQGQGHSKSTSELLHLQPRNSNSDACWQETELSACGEDGVQRQRPTSLSLKGHNYSSALKFLQGKKSSSKPEAGGGAAKHKPSVAHKSVRDSDKAPVKRKTSAPMRTASVEGVCENGIRAPPSVHLMTVENSEKIRRRVKTPVIPTKKNARLSLYDDRLMSSNPSDGSRSSNGALKKSSTSSRIAAPPHNNNNNNNKMDSVKLLQSESLGLENHPSRNSKGNCAMTVSDSDVFV
ncbi:hypothetical protein V1264_008428 [Littorina saxatilis]